MIGHSVFSRSKCTSFGRTYRYFSVFINNAISKRVGKYGIYCILKGLTALRFKERKAYFVRFMFMIHQFSSKTYTAIIYDYTRFLSVRFEMGKKKMPFMAL